MPGLYCKSPRRKPPKPRKKIFKNYLPTLIFSRYETGTTGIFLSLIIDEAEPRPIAILNEDLHTLVRLNKLYVLM